ncbi:MAG: hypothetical protein COA78_27205 [Blastopirellula sp.]|nr:MAG: hypothetical protein COA78_27205 [Blastopirellula sp.]
METSLHKKLKTIYAGEDAATEVRLGRYFIDAVVDDRLIEVQCSGLSAIRDKIQNLTKKHPVTVVKPIIYRKKIIKFDEQGGEIVSKRYSPKRGKLVDIFEELVYFTRAFPHKNLTLEVPLIEIEEHRFPGHGRKRRWRKNDHQVEDQHLVEILETKTFKTAKDLMKLIPGKLPRQFDTSHIAAAADQPRDVAQKMAYTLRNMGAIHEVGKNGNARLYQRGSGLRKKTKKAA